MNGPQTGRGRAEKGARLHLVPVTFTEARDFVAASHRHNRSPIGHKFSIGCADDNGTLRGGVLPMGNTPCPSDVEWKGQPTNHGGTA